jgi:hypothetical protein
MHGIYNFKLITELNFHYIETHFFYRSSDLVKICVVKAECI